MGSCVSTKRNEDVVDSLDQFCNDKDLKAPVETVSLETQRPTVHKYERALNPEEETVDSLLQQLDLDEEPQEKSDTKSPPPRASPRGAKIVFNSTRNEDALAAALNSKKNTRNLKLGPLYEALSAIDTPVNASQFTEVVKSLCSHVPIRLDKLFVVLDRDKDGVLKSEEVVAACKILGVGSADEQRTVMFSAYDGNSDKFLTRAELSELLRGYVTHCLTQLEDTVEFVRVEAEVFDEPVTGAMLTTAIRDAANHPASVKDCDGQFEVSLHTSWGDVTLPLSPNQLTDGGLVCAHEDSFVKQLTDSVWAETRARDKLALQDFLTHCRKTNCTDWLRGLAEEQQNKTPDVKMLF
eukprot:CAMPEP_0114553918 /NCGR_PEP_ID=MMETSP0114-20121206/7925_1 /TAXON_ID=31324 /ORGANISM="Goniomonas sp, Strain m" /LENGTH=351 /DNA_ID=CAMNT_0001738915 /DNA_START=31 /DNA_END=1086 /DNA_ORIENTATION=-